MKGTSFSEKVITEESYRSNDYSDADESIGNMSNSNASNINRDGEFKDDSFMSSNPANRTRIVHIKGNIKVADKNMIAY